MRTKTLLLTAALGAASLATSMAQVYSVNSVGYINLTMQAQKFNPVCNQLIAGINAIGQVIPTAPDAAQVITFVAPNYVVDAYHDEVVNPVGQPSGWYDPNGAASTTTLEPGKGFYYYDPSAASAYTVTFVGEVPQGPMLNVPIPTGLRFSGGIVPQRLPLRAVNGFPEVNGLQYIRFNQATTSYDVYSYHDEVVDPQGVPSGWYDGAGVNADAIAVADVGLGFFTSNSGSALSWTRCFNVNTPCP